MAAWFRRTWDRSPAFRRAVVWSALALVYWLDTDIAPGTVHAGPFAFIIPIAEAIWAAYTTVQDAIGTALEWVVKWLVAQVVWLAKVLKDFLRATGVMFSRVWDVFDTVWKRVLQPFLKWLDTQILKLRDWLRGVFQPVIDWLADVRGYIFDLYDRFVRPVLDLLDFIHQLRELLDLLHVHLLDAIDDFLQKIRLDIDRAFAFVYTWLSRLGYWVDFIITADGFFQRYALLRSEAKYIRDRWRLLINSRGHLPPHPFRNDKHVGKTPTTPQEITAATRQYLDFGSGAAAAVIDEVSIEVVKFLNA